MKSRVRFWATMFTMSALVFSVSACSTGSQEPKASSSSASSASTHLRIGLITQADIPPGRQMWAAFQKTLEKGSGLSGSSIQWVVKDAQGDSTQCPTIARTLAADNLDGIAGMGTPCIVAMAQADKTTPIFTLGIGDPIAAKVAKSLDKPGTNVTGNYQGTDASLPFAEILKVTPKPKKVGVIYDQSNDSVVAWVQNLQAAAKKENVALVRSGVSSADAIAPAARQLVSEVDMVLVGPDGLLTSALPAVASAAYQAKIPVFTSGQPTAPTIPGVVADVGSSYTEYGELGGQIAVKVLVHGANPATTPFAKATKMQWTVNKETAAQLGVVIPAKILDDATMVK